MLFSIAWFEFKRRTRLLSTWIYFTLFFALAFLLMITLAGAFPTLPVLAMLAGGKVNANAPFVLYQVLSGFCMYSLLLMSIFGQAIYQDFHCNAHPLFFTAPIKKIQYLGGRFLGAALSMLLILAAPALACVAACAMPFVDRSTIGPFSVEAYLLPYATSLVPNVLFIGALFFCVAALTRKMTPVYAGMVSIFMGYSIAESLVAKLENKFLAGMLDPFGGIAFRHLTEYWSVAEKNSRLVFPDHEVLMNRMAWLGFGAAALALTYFRFRFEQGGERGRMAPEQQPTPAEPSTPSAAQPAPPLRRPHPILLLPRLTWLALRETVKTPVFAVIALAGALFVFSMSRTIGSIYGTNTYPVTYEVVDSVHGVFAMFVLIVITLYSGELVWRERDAGLDQICDAMPIPGWLPFVSKLAALCFVQVLLLGLIIVCGVLIQAFKGYFNFELDVYFKQLFGVYLFGYLLLCVLTIAVQTIVNNKYVGHFVMVLYYIALAFMRPLGFEHRLYQYASNPGFEYSDMNRFGNYLWPIFWFYIYWGALALLLAIASNLFWVRGLDTGIYQRFALARARFTRPLQGLALLSGAIFAGAGGFIFYNTNILNKYLSSYAGECLRVEYENKYGGIRDLDQPRIVEQSVRFEIYPEAHRLEATGSYQLVNKSKAAITSLYVGLSSDVDVQRLALGAIGKPTLADKNLGVYRFDLAEPMKPGDALPLEFTLRFGRPGFSNNGVDTTVLDNGTFFHSTHLPRLGYNTNMELGEDAQRKKHGLKPRTPMAGANDMKARMNNYISSDGDWISLDVTIGTSRDQTAIAPGYLQRDWEENGRRYFHYKTTNPILNYYAILSARYEIRREDWNGVPLEIYYHKGHEYNLDSMFKAMKAALEYCTANFSPYQHKQMRIIEFPRIYGSFAQSFPNTVPYSESVGFIARVDPDNSEDIDYPFYITAHEISHQWWAHQVIGGNVQGCTMLSESLAQYTSLMLMKKEFGPDKIRRFLKYELNQYLMSRGSEHFREMCLCQVCIQPYIHYNKGSLAMYALQDYIGEDAVNRALKSFLKAVAYQPPPYTNSYELLKQFRKVTPPDLQYVIGDMFESIVLYENRALSAKYRKIAGGKYEVHVKVAAKKLSIDDYGVEHEVPIKDLIDIGVEDSAGKMLYLKKEWIRENNCEFTIVVDGVPAKAGIDPLNKLIDRKPDDNVVSATEEN